MTDEQVGQIVAAIDRARTEIVEAIDGLTDDDVVAAVEETGRTVVTAVQTASYDLAREISALDK